MVLSVSRRTDIPQFYSEWFFNRMQEGFLYVRNPMNHHAVSRIHLTPNVTDCIVFWTKNPEPMLEHIPKLGNVPFYTQMTLTGYDRDIEAGSWDKQHLIRVFQNMADITGADRMVWRYDPIFLSDRYTIAFHKAVFSKMAEALSGYTHKVVISFLDLYGKTRRNMGGIPVQLPDIAQMQELCEFIAQIAGRYNMKAEACAEFFDFSAAGVKQGSCINKSMVESVCGYPVSLKKDKNQRAGCGCMESVEVGTYDTCLNGCRYCYANVSRSAVESCVQYYDPKSPFLCGQPEPGDIITVRKMESLRRLV